MIVIAHYGVGNVRSVLNAFQAIGADARVTETPALLAEAERIVLPGVGAFGEATRRLAAAGFLEALDREVREKGKPFLGLCVGMQLLAERGLEHGEHRGLGWIRGEVRRLAPRDPSLRVPHMGWNSVMPRPGSRLLAGLPAGSSFYFVHSYHLVAGDASAVAGTADYGEEITAVVEQGHIFGTQFHPEKSQKAGLQLLRNFLAVPSC